MTGDTTQPIAVYEDRRPGARNRFELFSNAIHVRVANGQTEAETTISLVQLDPSITRIWGHSQMFFVGMGVFIVAIILLLVVVTVVMTQDVKSFPARPMELVGVVAAAGIALLVANRRKIEYAQFRSVAGTPILSIPSGRKDRSDFDHFVASLVAQINQLRDDRQTESPRQQH